MIEELSMFSPSGRCVSIKLEDPFAVYSRRSFDNLLLERACAAGAEIINEKVKLDKERATDGCWVVRSRTGNCWLSRVVVAADGANSPIAKRLAGPLSNHEMEVAFGYRTPLDINKDGPTVIAFLPGWSGYAWAFPRLDHVSFGIATAQDAFEHQSLDEFLWGFMVRYFSGREGEAGTDWFNRDEAAEGDGSARKVEAYLRRTAVRYAARIPGLSAETLERRRAAGEDWALLGDAAGFADPVTGEGIYYALRSAELLAEAYAGGDIAEYDRMWREDFGLELRRASEMRGRFYGRFLGATFTDLMIILAKLHPGVRRTLRGLVAGEQDYTSLKRTLSRRAFLPF